MLEVQRSYEKLAIDFRKHAVAITRENSKLDKLAMRDNWLCRFPMWNWVGGRTSVFSAVGLLPAALQGIDINGMLEGAKAMDILTRNSEIAKNPAAILARMWFQVGSGKGEKSMVIIPYKDRLDIFSRYLQQLVMESLGKEKDLEGKTVHQGMIVFGNKGSTDQHSFLSLIHI